MIIDQGTVGELIESVAARQPTPGGGAVAALTAALAAALGEMVIRYRLGKPSAASHEGLHSEALSALGRLRSAFIELADADAEAFARLSQLWKLNPDDPRRREQWTDAVGDAIATPQRVMQSSLEALEVLHRVQETVGRNLVSDLAIAALLAQAGAEAAAWNVRVNLPQLEDTAEADRLASETEAMVARAGTLRAAIERTCREMGEKRATERRSDEATKG